MQVPQALASWKRLSNISGWFSFEATMMFALIDEVQKANGITGNLFEIGTHHGRSAVLLANMLAPSQEKLAVCDIFEQQGENVSHSGSGNRKIFEQNVCAQLPRTEALQVFACLSDQLTAEQIGNGYRIFHIDGGHNTHEALGDLRLAAKTLTPGGVIILDDAFRDVWPGVSEALLLFLQESPDFAGLALGFNKMLFTHRASIEIYRQKLLDRTQLAEYHIRFPWHVKQVPLAGSDVLIYYVPESLKRRSISNLSRGLAHSWGQRRLPIVTKSVSR
ncbi:MAG: class I SAM-dependent methyltransferase [Bythopirellula sp.]|nr:class I SAM-dependent methyltransferase [Bythopirellula sp.]